MADVRIIEVPCPCSLSRMLDPSWEGFACACIGPSPSFQARDGQVGFLAVIDSYVPPNTLLSNKDAVELARLVLEGREELTLPEWLEKIRAAAEKIKSEER